jgi:hypothetical protein
MIAPRSSFALVGLYDCIKTQVIGQVFLPYSILLYIFSSRVQKKESSKRIKQKDLGSGEEKKNKKARKPALGTFFCYTPSFFIVLFTIFYTTFLFTT